MKSCLLLAGSLLIALGVDAQPPQGSALPSGATDQEILTQNILGDGLKVVDRVMTATDQARLRHRLTLAQAFAEIRAGKLAEAIKTLEASLAAEPSSTVALVQLAELCYRDDTARAQSYLDKAAAVDPDYYRLHLIQALIHQKTGKFDPMLASLNRCLEITPEQTVARKLRADYLQQRVESPDSLRKAIDDYSSLQQALPQQALYWSFYIGRCYFHLKEYGKAQKFLEPVLGTPLGPQAAYLMGLCKQELGQYAEALNYLSRIKGNPLANENVARIALIQAESATGELRMTYKSRALEELSLLLKNPSYKARPDQFLIAGKLSLELGLPGAAVEHLEKYLDKVPKDPTGQGLLLRAHLLEADPQSQNRAEELYRSYLGVIPATAAQSVRLEYVKYLIKMREWNKVSGELDLLSQAKGDNGDIAYLKAQVAFGKEDFALAIQEASRAAQLVSRRRDEIEILIGTACLNQNDLEGASRHYNRAIDSASDSLKGLRCLEIGNLYQDKKMIREKLAYWNQALDLHPGNHQLRYEVGLAYLRGGTPELATPYFERISKEVKEDNLRSQAETILGYVAIVEGATDSAISHYQAAINAWEGNVPALRGLGHLMSDLNRYEEARGLFKKAVAQEPEDATLCIQLGIVCDKLSDVPGAEAAARAAMSASPDYAEAYNFLGYMYAERGIQLDDAEDLVKKALELEPDNPNILDSLGWVYFQKGEYPRALDLLEKSISLLAGEHLRGASVIYEHLGDVYEKLGRTEQAIEMWKKAAEGDPKSTTAGAKIERATGKAGAHPSNGGSSNKSPR